MYNSFQGVRPLYVRPPEPYTATLKQFASQKARKLLLFLALGEALVARGACVVRRAGVSPRRAEEALENAAKLEALELFLGV